MSHQLSQSDESHLFEDSSNDSNSNASEQKNMPNNQIVAQEPIKTFEIVQEQSKTLSDDQNEQEPKKELGGTLIYDSYARILGNTKIVKYFKTNQFQPVNKTLVFSQKEQDELYENHFGEKAREVDFKTDNDKQFFKNLSKFQGERTYQNLQYDLFVPQMQNILIFDSRFENGNLRKVSKVNNVEYNLWLENDWNTKGHTQWYYFKIIYKDITLGPEKKVHKIKFNILNLAKTTSLYQDGMMPCVWSKRKNEQDGTGWFRCGTDITYTKNEIPRLQESEKVINLGNQFLYQQNGAGEGTETYFTFSFKYNFEPNQNDELWFAHAVPYTYTQMQQKVKEIKDDEKYSEFLKVNQLCETLGRNPVPMYTITSKIDTFIDYYDELNLKKLPSIVRRSYRILNSNSRRLEKQGQNATQKVQKLLEQAIHENYKQFCEQHQEEFLQLGSGFENLQNKMLSYFKDHGMKKGIVITCRVHPGEPQGSHMLDGLIDYIISPQGEELRNNFVIRIVPMLNPDGVIYGNYRCSLLGCDLNRKWDKPNRLLHPPIFYSKQLIKHMHQERRILMYCDLHGHSRKQNAFFYGCSYKNFEQEGRLKNAQLRIIPLICCQKNKLFRIEDCRFNIERSKESTARVVMFNEFNIMNSFTLECSFFGKELKDDGMMIQKKEQPRMMLGMPMPMASISRKKRFEHMSIQEYQSLGGTLMQTMNNYLPEKISNLRFLTGKILNVFYEEFTKFVPAYILKREEEKRLKEEQEAYGKQGAKVDMQTSIKISKKQTANLSLNLKLTINDQQSKKGDDSIVQSQDNLLKDDFSSGSEYKLDIFPNLAESTEGIQKNKDKDVYEFENFIQNIQSKMNKSAPENKAKDNDSSDGSSVEDDYKRKKVKKKKKKERAPFQLKTEIKAANKAQEAAAKKKADELKHISQKKKKSKANIGVSEKICKTQINSPNKKLKSRGLKLPNAQKQRQYREFPMRDDENFQSIIIKNINQNEIEHDSLIGQITSYVEQNIDQDNFRIENDYDHFYEDYSPIYDKSPITQGFNGPGKLKQMNVSYQDDDSNEQNEQIQQINLSSLNQNIRVASIENLSRIQRSQIQKNKQINASSTAFYAHLVPKDTSQMITGTTYDKVLGGKIKFQHPHSPGSPIFFSEQNDIQNQHYHFQPNVVVLPQLAPQSSMQDNQESLQLQFISQQSQLSKKGARDRHFSQSERVTDNFNLRKKQQKQYSMIQAQMNVNSFAVREGMGSSNIQPGQIDKNDFQISNNPYDLNLIKQPPFRIKKANANNYNFINPNYTAPKKLRTGNKDEMSIYNQDLPKMPKNYEFFPVQKTGNIFDTPIPHNMFNISQQMQQEPIINSKKNNQTHTECRVSENSRMVPENKYSESGNQFALKSTPLILEPISNQNSAEATRNKNTPQHLKMNQINLTEGDDFHHQEQSVDSKYMGSQSSMLPELKNHNIMKISNYHNQQQQKEIIEQQKQLQKQLNQQQYILYAMQNQIENQQQLSQSHIEYQNRQVMQKNVFEEFQNNPNIGFSHFQPKNHWQQDVSQNRLTMNDNDTNRDTNEDQPMFKSIDSVQQNFNIEKSKSSNEFLRNHNKKQILLNLNKCNRANITINEENQGFSTQQVISGPIQQSNLFNHSIHYDLKNRRANVVSRPSNVTSIKQQQMINQIKGNLFVNQNGVITRHRSQNANTQPQTRPGHNIVMLRQQPNRVHLSSKADQPISLPSQNTLVQRRIQPSTTKGFNDQSHPSQTIEISTRNTNQQTLNASKSLNCKQGKLVG